MRWLAGVAASVFAVVSLAAAPAPQERPSARPTERKKADRPTAGATEDEARDGRNRLGFPLERAWEARLPAAIEGPALATGKRVLALTAEGDLLAYDLQDGKQLWKFQLGFRPQGGPLAVGALIVVAGRDGQVLALNPSRPDIAWQITTETRITAPLASSSELILVGQDSGDLLALSAQSGAEQWRFRAAGPLLAGAGVAGDFVYQADARGAVHQLRLQDGQRQWSASTGGAVSAAPLVEGELVFVGSNDNHAYAFRIADGEPAWKVRLGADLTAPPVAFGDAVLFACLDGRLYFLRQDDGHRILAPFLYFRLAHPPLVANAIAFISPMADQLAGIDPSTGQIAGTFALGALAASPLAYARDTLFLGLGDRRLLALRRVPAAKRKLLEASTAVQSKLLGKLPVASSAEEQRYDTVLRTFDQALRDAKIDSSFAGDFLDRLEKLEPDQGFQGHEDELLELLGTIEKRMAAQQQELWNALAEETLSKGVVPILPTELSAAQREQVLGAFRRLLLATYSGQIDAATSSQFMQTYTPLVNDGDVTADDLQVLTQAIDRLLAEHPAKASTAHPRAAPPQSGPAPAPPEAQTQPQNQDPN